MNMYVCVRIHTCTYDVKIYTEDSEENRHTFLSKHGHQAHRTMSS